MPPLTLRPTDIGTPAAFQHLKDYCVFEDGERIGRIYQVHAATKRIWVLLARLFKISPPFDQRFRKCL